MGLGGEAYTSTSSVMSLVTLSGWTSLEMAMASATTTPEGKINEPGRRPPAQVSSIGLHARQSTWCIMQLDEKFNFMTQGPAWLCQQKTRWRQAHRLRKRRFALDIQLPSDTGEWIVSTANSVVFKILSLLSLSLPLSFLLLFSPLSLPLQPPHSALFPSYLSPPPFLSPFPFLPPPSLSLSLSFPLSPFLLLSNRVSQTTR